MVNVSASSPFPVILKVYFGLREQLYLLIVKLCWKNANAPKEPLLCDFTAVALFTSLDAVEK